MNRRLLLCLAVCAVLAPAPAARADNGDALASPTSDPPSTLASGTYPQITCTGTNAQAVADVVQLGADTRDALTSVLQLGPVWRYPVHVTLLDPKPGQKPPREAVSAITDGKNLRVEASLSSTDPLARAFIQRQFVNALLWEKFFKKDASFTAQTRLDAVPLWLLEGLRESLNDDPDHNREEIVKRAAMDNRAPTLAEVTGWKDLSSDRLLGLWQGAFCYYLVDSLTHPQARLADFQQWLASITGPNPASAVLLFPTEMGWQRELRAADGRSQNLVYSWDESAAALTAAETIALPKEKGQADVRLCTIETIGSIPRSATVNAAINKKVLELTALQLRIHPSWQPIVELYRFGLTALARDNDPQRAAEYIHQAHLRRAAEINIRTKLLDYTNWFEVTQNLPPTASPFRSYFQVAQELDKAEGDAQHPNPIRADLLKVESEF